MNGQWELVEVPAPYGEGYAWGGLLIVYSYDFECGLVPNQFEIHHRSSGEVMLEVEGTIERVQEIATDLADLANWEALSTTDELMLQAKLMAFGAGYPREVSVVNDWGHAGEMEGIVPYADML